MKKQGILILIAVIVIVAIALFWGASKIISNITLSEDKEIMGEIKEVYQERPNFDVRVTFQDDRIFIIQNNGEPAYINFVYAMIKSNEGNNISICYKTDAIGNNIFQYLKNINL